MFYRLVFAQHLHIINTKVVYHKDAHNSQGKALRIIQFTHQRQTKTLSTGTIVNPSVWYFP